jgi:hypothetical protein
MKRKASSKDMIKNLPWKTMCFPNEGSFLDMDGFISLETLDNTELAKTTDYGNGTVFSIKVSDTLNLQVMLGASSNVFYLFF